MTVIMLGLDPGFASIGYSVVSVSNDGAEGSTKTVLENLGTLRTEKSSKKTKVLASDDNFRRAREISKMIRGLCSAHGVDCICAESMSFPRNASTAAKMAMTWGVIADICENQGIAMLMATPKELKKAVCKGNGSASKEEVQAAMDSQFQDAKELLDAEGIPTGQREHPYDALAAVVACINSEQVRLLLKSRPE